MKRISLIVYKTIHEFGYTHVSVHVQGEAVEWCYASTNGVQSAPLQQFQPEIWQCTHIVPIGIAKDDVDLSETVLTLKDAFADDKYDLYLHNCWHFTEALLKTLVLETEVDIYNAIYRSSDYHFGLPPYSTRIIYSVLWAYHKTVDEAKRWKAYGEDTFQSCREYVTGFCKRDKQA